jgi:hypothetical protein
MATGSGATLLWNTSSGYFVYVASSLRYKTDLADFNGGLSLVKQLKPFYYTPVYDAKAREIGLAAEHVAELLPQIVTWKEYEVDGITKNLPESLDYARLTPVLASAIQELYGEFDERLSTLEKSFAERNAS